jgi:2-polyprenyl-3-methyl-5-hydroxy-6-metoxy-1,4-benzoquinol methylase
MINTDWEQRYIEKDTPWDSGKPSTELQRLVSEGKVKPGRVLELGCGTGTNAIFLASLGFEVTAVDLSLTALERAREKAREAKVTVNFIQADVTALPDLGGPFPFVFDRGTYHVVRTVNLSGFQKMLAKVVEPLGIYLILAGNANTLAPTDVGPPVVRASELCSELESDCFDVLELKQTHFNGVMIGGKEFSPMAWAAILQRREQNRK